MTSGRARKPTQRQTACRSPNARTSLVFRTEPLESRPGSHRHDPGQALGLLDRARHRLHGQADRRDPPEPRLSPGLRPEPGRFDLRTRYREGLDHQAPPLEPGEIAEITITLYPNSNVFKKGHRIRVDVSSSNYPRFDVNPNTGEPLGEYRRMVPADNTIHHDHDHPSQVILPVVPGE